MPRYIHPQSLVPWEWLYCATIYPPPLSSYIFTPDNIWWGGDYIMTLYFHSWQYLVRGWLYRDLIFSLLTIFGEGGGLYRDLIFSLLTIFGEGVIISWHYFHSWRSPRIWRWRWLHFDIFTIQIWLCSDTRVLLFIYIYSPHETWG